MKQFLTSLLVLIIVSGCVNQKAVDKRIKVVCTTNIIADAFANILPENNFEVISLMGPGTDPHLYQATPKDLNNLKNSEIIIANGLHLEGKLVEILEKLGEEKQVIQLSKFNPKSAYIKLEDNVYDPHFWFNLELWTNSILKATEFIKPGNSEISKKAKSYCANLIAIDKEYETLFAQVDSSKRHLITAHDAFSYYAKRYNIYLMSIQGVSTSSEYGVKDILNLANHMVANQISTAFFESSIPKKSTETLLKACASEGLEIKLSGPLYSDALGAKESEAGTLLKMFEHNSKLILEGMQ